MSKTRQDLIERALKLLRVLAAGQGPAIEDFATVEALVEPVVDALSRREIVYISDIEEIEDAFFFDLAVVLAHHSASEFGQPPEVIGKSQAEAERDLEDMTRAGPTYEPMTPDYY